MWEAVTPSQYLGAATWYGERQGHWELPSWRWLPLVLRMENAPTRHKTSRKIQIRLRTLVRRQKGTTPKRTGMTRCLAQSLASLPQGKDNLVIIEWNHMWNRLHHGAPRRTCAPRPIAKGLRNYAKCHIGVHKMGLKKKSKMSTLYNTDCAKPWGGLTIGMWRAAWRLKSRAWVRIWKTLTEVLPPAIAILSDEVRYYKMNRKRIVRFFSIVKFFYRGFLRWQLISLLLDGSVVRLAHQVRIQIGLGSNRRTRKCRRVW